MDPITLAIGGATLAVGPFIATIGTQLAHRLMPPGWVKASLASVELRREELRSQEQRFLKQIAEARQLKMDELQQIYLNQRSLRDDDFRIRHWPLSTLPIDMLLMSQSHHSCALNIIIKGVTPGENPTQRNSPHSENSLLDFIASNAIAFDRLKNHFGNSMLLWIDPARSHRLYGDGLRSSIWACLQTEPVVLIEVHAPSVDKLVFSISHWGNAFDPTGHPVTIAPITLDLKKVDIRSRQVASLVALSSIFVTLGDAFQALHFPAAFPSPVFPKVIGDIADSNLTLDIWWPLISAYPKMYEMVASHSPQIASELAATAALAAHNAKQPDFAKSLLDKALALHPRLSLQKVYSDDFLKKSLLRQRGADGKPSQLERTLVEMRGWQASSTTSKQPCGDINEILRRFGTS